MTTEAGPVTEVAGEIAETQDTVPANTSAVTSSERVSELLKEHLGDVDQGGDQPTGTTAAATPPKKAGKPTKDPKAEAGAEPASADADGALDPEAAAGEGGEGEEAAAEDDAEGGEDEAAGAAEPPPKWALKRISKITAQKNELKAQVEQLNARLQELGAPKRDKPIEGEGSLEGEAGEGVKSRKASKIDQVSSLPELERRASGAQDLLDWAEENLIALKRYPDRVSEALRQEGVALKNEAGEEDYAQERVEEYLLSVRHQMSRSLRVEIPRRHEFLRKQGEAEVKAVEVFPWLKDKASKEYQAAQKVLEYMPELRQRPDWKMAVGVYVTGWLAIQASAVAKRKAGVTNGKPVKGAPRLPASEGSARPAVDDRAAGVAKAREKLLEPGGAVDYARAVLPPIG